MKYSERKTIEKLGKALKKPALLYKRAFINWSGNASDAGKDYYTEIIAGKLIESDLIRNSSEYIEVVKRRSSYRVHSHTINKKRGISNREEEIFAKLLVGREIGMLGKIIDYQVPLKNKNTDKGVGKIDLVSVRDDTAYLIELKYADNKETLLRAVLEIWTYWHRLDRKKFLVDFGLRNVRHVRRAILLMVGCLSYKEATESNLSARKNLKELLKRLDVDVFLLDKITKII